MDKSVQAKLLSQFFQLPLALLDVHIRLITKEAVLLKSLPKKHINAFESLYS